MPHHHGDATGGSKTHPTGGPFENDLPRYCTTGGGRDEHADAVGLRLKFDLDASRAVFFAHATEATLRSPATMRTSYGSPPTTSLRPLSVLADAPQRSSCRSIMPPVM